MMSQIYRQQHEKSHEIITKVIIVIPHIEPWHRLGTPHFFSKENRLFGQKCRSW